MGAEFREVCGREQERFAEHKSFDIGKCEPPSSLNGERFPGTLCAPCAPEFAQRRVLADDPVPLTLALSPAERENRRPSVRPTEPFGTVEGLTA